MKIIQHPESFEVISDDGAIVKQFPFDDNASRRAISGQMTKKQAFVARQDLCGEGPHACTSEAALESKKAPLPVRARGG
jgi:hypothetical protein